MSDTTSLRTGIRVQHFVRAITFLHLILKLPDYAPRNEKSLWPQLAVSPTSRESTVLNSIRTHQRVAMTLGYLGALPFVFGCMAVPHPLAVELLVNYSAAIATFLCGNIWSVALLSRSTTGTARCALLISSNIAVLVTVGLLVIPPAPGTFLGLALVFALLLFVDLMHPAFSPQPDYYRRMRIRVSAIVVALHLAAGVRMSQWWLENLA